MTRERISGIQCDGLRIVLDGNQEWLVHPADMSKTVDWLPSSEVSIAEEGSQLLMTNHSLHPAAVARVSRSP
jgi:hypothetical protein